MEPTLHEFTVVALVRPWEIPWGDPGAIGSALVVDWVCAESAAKARSAFPVAYEKRTGLAPEDVAVAAVFAGHITEGGPRPSIGAAARVPAADGPAKAIPGGGPALLSTKQFLERHACLTMPWLRAALFNRRSNGLAAATVQCGRKILIDETKFFEWLEAQQGRGATRDPRKERA